MARVLVLAVLLAAAQAALVPLAGCSSARVRTVRAAVASMGLRKKVIKEVSQEAGSGLLGDMMGNASPGGGGGLFPGDDMGAPNLNRMRSRVNDAEKEPPAEDNGGSNDKEAPSGDASPPPATES